MGMARHCVLIWTSALQACTSATLLPIVKTMSERLSADVTVVSKMSVLVIKATVRILMSALPEITNALAKMSSVKIYPVVTSVHAKRDMLAICDVVVEVS